LLLACTELIENFIIVSVIKLYYEIRLASAKQLLSYFIGSDVRRLYMLKAHIVVIVVAGLLCRCMLH